MGNRKSTIWSNFLWFTSNIFQPSLHLIKKCLDMQGKDHTFIVFSVDVLSWGAPRRLCAIYSTWQMKKAQPSPDNYSDPVKKNKSESQSYLEVQTRPQEYICLSFWTFNARFDRFTCLKRTSKAHTNFVRPSQSLTITLAAAQWPIMDGLTLKAEAPFLPQRWCMLPTA